MRHPVGLLSLGVAVLLGGVPSAPGVARTDAGGDAPSAVATVSADITSLAAVNNASTIAVGLANGHVAIWNGITPSPTIEFKPHEARVLAVGATADGEFVLSVATDGSLVKTRSSSGAISMVERVDLGPAPTRAAVFSTDGTRLITGGEFGDIRVFDTASGQLKHTLRGHRSELQDLAARPGSTLLASAGAEADIRVWDTASGAQVALVDNDLSSFALAFSPRDGTLASGGTDRRVTLRDPATFAQTRSAALKAPWMVSTLAWSPDGRQVVLGDLDDATLSRGGIQVMDAGSLAVVKTLDTEGKPASRLTCSWQGGRVVAVVGRQLRAWMLPAPQ